MSEYSNINNHQVTADNTKKTCSQFVKRTLGWSFLGRDVIKIMDGFDDEAAGINLSMGLSYIPVISQIAALILLAKIGWSNMSASIQARLVIGAIGLGPLCIIVDAVCSITTAILARKAVNLQDAKNTFPLHPTEESLEEEDIDSDSSEAASSSSSTPQIAASSQSLTHATPLKILLPRDHENVKELERFTEEELRHPDYTIHSDQFEILDSIVETIPSPEALAETQPGTTTVDLGIDWFYIHKPTMTKLGFEGLYEELRQNLMNEGGDLLGVQSDEEGIFIPHALETVEWLIDYTVKSRVTKVEIDTDSIFEPSYEEYILDDNGSKITPRVFYDQFEKYHPLRVCAYSFRLTDQEEEDRKQFFERLQEKVKLHYHYHIKADYPDSLQIEYTKIAKEELSKLMIAPPKYPNGLILGECHSDRAPKDYLVTRMDRLKELGFTELYFEHIPSSLQPLFDADWDSLDNMPCMLINVLNNLYSRGYNEGHTFTDVVVAAKKAGIRVVFFETQISYNTVENGGQISKNRDERIPMMNYRLWEKMQEIPPRGKYITLVGGAHITLNKNTPGLKEILGGISVYVFDKSN